MSGSPKPRPGLSGSGTMPRPRSRTYLGWSGLLVPAIRRSRFATNLQQVLGVSRRHRGVHRVANERTDRPPCSADAEAAPPLVGARPLGPRERVAYLLFVAVPSVS